MIQNGSETGAAMVTKDICVSSPEWELRAQVTVPTGPTPMSEMLPLARALSDAIVSQTIRVHEQAGDAVSCKMGCGACCRHLVAISEVEARRLGQVINGMEEPRRSSIQARFAAARAQLADEGLLERLENPDTITGEEYGSVALTYFNQQIACPFLEEESCSIYEERPITCREYLVTSPPVHCAVPAENKVRRIRMPLRVFNAVARWQASPTGHFKEKWVPLILAPEWAGTNSEEPSVNSGVELLGELLHHLSVKEESD
jgi:Fe-S-cluster containining protein